MTIHLQNNIIYGPVKSRRLGSSLGINILSSKKKICNFNCVYCQYGWTKVNQLDLIDVDNFQKKPIILDKVEKALFALSPSPDYITFSGNGEATLHPNFVEIVDGAVELRNKYARNTKTAILSNSMTVVSREMRNSLNKLDFCIMKLDCGTEELFKNYNRPITSISLNTIVQHLALIRKITIQSLFTKGLHGNSDKDQVEKWIDKLQIIKPIAVQIYTLDRGYPSKKIEPVTFEWLYELQEKLNRLNINAKAYI